MTIGVIRQEGAVTFIGLRAVRPALEFCRPHIALWLPKAIGW